MPLLDPHELASLSPYFTGPKGLTRANRLLRFFKVDKVEESYARVEHLLGPEAASTWLENMDIHYSVRGIEKLQALSEGPCIFVSNHTIGTIDGIILIALLGAVRPDVKMLVNNFLSRLKVLKDNFIEVTPTGEKRTSPTAKSISGIRAALVHLQEGHALGLFPSGAVSDLKLGKRPVVQMPDGSVHKEPFVRDREWQLPMIRFIHKAKVPVVPIRIFDGNSPFFYMLGLLDWRVRLLRQPAEVLNKGGKTLRFSIGDVISVDDQAACKDPLELRRLLRGAVYSQQW